MRRAAQRKPAIRDPLRRSRSQTGSGDGAGGSHATHGGVSIPVEAFGAWSWLAAGFTLTRPRSRCRPIRCLRPEDRTGARRARYRHVHTAAELAAFDRSREICDAIRGAGLDESERWCPGGCGKIIRRERRSCGRRWCDAVRPSWAASFRSVIHGALNAYCDLYGAEAKVLQGVLTCTAEPWWWDRSKCSHSADVTCSGPLGCRVLDSVAEDQRRLWSARRRDTMNTARTAAIRQLRREGWAEPEWPSLLLWVLEDQSRGVPHLHFALGHTTALEKAFARSFFRALKPVAYAQGLGHTSTYERALLEQGKYEAGRLRHYVSKLAGYLSGDGAAAFLQRHSGERVFYVAPWLSRLSGVTMTISRLSRRVWAARKGFCAMPKMTDDQERLVYRLLGVDVLAPNGP